MAATLLVVSFLVFLAFAVIPGIPPLRSLVRSYAGQGGGAAGGDGLKPSDSRALCRLAGRPAAGRYGNLLQLQHACNENGVG